MRNILALPVLLLALGGTAHAAERSFAVGAFHRIASSGSSDVIVTVGPVASVRAEGDAVAIDRLRIAVAGGELRIGTQPNRGFRANRGRATVRVTVPSLDGALLSGSGNMRIDQVAGLVFEASVDGSGNLGIGALRADRARFRVDGSGGVEAAGAVGRIDIDVRGSGNADLGAMDSRDAWLAVSGSGNAELRSARTADVSVSGSGNASVGGRPHCTVRKSGSGTVRCG